MERWSGWDVVTSREPLTVDAQGSRTGSEMSVRARAMDNNSKHLTTHETPTPQFKQEEVANTMF